MRKASQITHEIILTVEQIDELTWQLNELWKHFEHLQKELQHFIKYNRTINLK